MRRGEGAAYKITKGKAMAPARMSKPSAKRRENIANQDILIIIGYRGNQEMENIFGNLSSSTTTQTTAINDNIHPVVVMMGELLQ